MARNLMPDKSQASHNSRRNKMKAKCLLISFFLIFSLFLVRESRAYVIDFEGLTDGDSVTNQYSGLGVSFSNAMALTAGISLNEFEFPPFSGFNVVFDDAGEMTLNFTAPVLDAGGYFTYLVPLALSFFDAHDNLEGTVISAFSSNLALSGDTGSSPNEFLNFASASGISKLVITGDPAGGSFTMDNLTATPSSVPEPATLMLLGSGLLGITGYRLRGLKNRSNRKGG